MASGVGEKRTATYGLLSSLASERRNTICVQDHHQYSVAQKVQRTIPSVITRKFRSYVGVRQSTLASLARESMMVLHLPGR
jgi:hypothetical protein